jgi:hypothetical protein
MRRTVSLLFLSLAVAAVACSDDDGPGGPSLEASYEIQSLLGPTLTVDQDQSIPLLLTVTKDGEPIKFPLFGEVDVLPAGQGFSPETVHVDAGGIVIWHHPGDGERHGIDFRTAPAALVDIPVGIVVGTAGIWESGDSARAMPVSQRDTLYTYRCPIHTADSGYIRIHTGPTITFRSDDYSIANVSSRGLVTGVRGGSTIIRASVSGTTIEVPITVRPRPATRIELTFVDPLRMDDRLTQDTIFAYPGDRASSQLRAVVMSGPDTVFCNRCANFDTRPQRFVEFISLDTTKILVTNTANPLLRPDTTGRMYGRDTTPGTSTVGVVLRTNDGLEDTVQVHVKLRPIDSLEVRLDSLVDPEDDEDRIVYPSFRISLATGNDFAPAGIVGLGVTFRSKVQDPPDLRTGILPRPRWIAVLETGTGRRPNLPVVTWESANATYASVSTGGLVSGGRADVSNANLLLTCSYNPATDPTPGVIASAFDGPSPPTPPLPVPPAALPTTAETNNFNTQARESRYTIPGCSPAITFQMPGVVCTSAAQNPTTNNDPNSFCQIWIRATAVDPVTGKILTDKALVTVTR